MSSSDWFDLQGKTAIVTGGAGLIGSETCTALTAHDATVIVAESDEEAGRELSNELGSRGCYKYLDITEERSVMSLVREVEKDHGRIDLLVNCSYPRTEAYGQQFEDVNLEEWNRNVAMQLGGYYATCHHAAKSMIKRGNGGCIINIGSIYGMQAPDFSVYTGTDMTSPVEYAGVKGGVINLTRYLASYLGEYGIRVNTVSPGGVYDNQDHKFVENYKERTPLGRMATSKDVAGAIVFLISDAATYVTGHNLVVDGGWSIK